jgi:hypothetical protein
MRLVRNRKISRRSAAREINRVETWTFERIGASLDLGAGHAGTGEGTPARRRHNDLNRVGVSPYPLSMLALIVVIFVIAIALMVWIDRVRDRNKRHRLIPCSECGGTGTLNYGPCVWCHGYRFRQTDRTGEVVHWQPYDITSSKSIYDEWREQQSR